MIQLKTLYSKFSHESHDIFEFPQTQILQIMYREGSQQSMNDKCLIVQYIFAASYCFYHRHSLVVTQLTALQQVRNGRKEAFRIRISANAESVQNIE